MPPDVVDLWPEIFKDIEIKIVPYEYLYSVRIEFIDGKTWDIEPIDSSKGGIEDLQNSLDELFLEYSDNIQSVDFQLDTEKIKEDITQRTKEFLRR